MKQIGVDKNSVFEVPELYLKKLFELKICDTVK